MYDSYVIIYGTISSQSLHLVFGFPSNAGKQIKSTNNVMFDNQVEISVDTNSFASFLLGNERSKYSLKGKS